jgi:hypothetical protein
MQQFDFWFGRSSLGAFFCVANRRRLRHHFFLRIASARRTWIETFVVKRLGV